MAEQAFLHALQGLTSVMQNLTQMLASGQIVSFKEDLKLFKKWIKSLQKFALLERVEPEKLKLFAFRASTGAVSDFIQRYLNAEPNATWEALKNELAQRFAEITDSQHILSLLRGIRQAEKENVQIFAKRLLSLAEQAPGVTEEQLVGIFVDGLYSDKLRLKVMRDDPKTIAAAIKSARQEYTLQQRFYLRTGRDYFAPQSSCGEPMEIDHYRPNQNKRPFGEKRYLPRPKHQKVSAVEVRYNKEIVCWNCHKKGHIRHKLSLP